jgi:BirA family biotin operon repressor/biotin-[acetyl-CoA-carboxylase] ligase
MTGRWRGPAAGAPHGALVTADAQTHGRGRLGRAWESPPGGLYASLILRPVGAAWGAVGLAVGLGVREGLARWLPRATLKWPNDVLCDGRKLSGVLCETRWFGGVAELVAGFGVNVEQRGFPAELHATSVAIELAPGTCPSRQEVLTAVLEGLEGALALFFAGGFAAIRGRYEAHSAVLGRRVRVGDEEAEAVGFDDDGALRVRVGATTRRVEAGDVWLT